MAGLLSMGIVGGVAVAVDKIQTKRRAKKAKTLAEQETEVNAAQLQSAKAREANADAQLGDDEDHTLTGRRSTTNGRVDYANVHPALRPSIDIPPPYHAPEYREEDPHPENARGRSDNGEGSSTSQITRSRSLNAPDGETEQQRKDRKYREFFDIRSGTFWGLIGIGIASGLPSCGRTQGIGSRRTPRN